MIRTFLAVLLVSIVGCGTIPRSADEMRELYRSGPPLGGSKAERTLERPLPQVLADVRRNADKCFNVVTDHSTQSSAGFGQARLKITYRSTTTRTSDSNGELLVRMIVPHAGRQPEGGYYAVLGDLVAVSPTRTRLTVCGSSGSSWKEPLEAVFTWAAGQDRSCPQLP
jgi:hypothetical protein